MLLVDTLDDLELLPGRVRHPASGREVPLSVLAATMTEHERICISQFLMPVVREVPGTGKEFRIGFPHLFFAHAAHLARIEVDELTGTIEVKDWLAATEAGRVLNPQGFEQQVQGAVAQGIGYGILEEVKLRDGRILTPDFAAYILPGALDVPEIISLVEEVEEPTGPYGMKGVGEVGANGPLPAIANALADGCGISMTRAPLTAEGVLEALRRKGTPGAGETS